MIEQTISVDNISVEIFYDQFADNPRDWDNETKFVMFHRRYNLPNELDIRHEDYASWGEMEKELQAQYKWVYPVFMYDHSGVAFSINSFECRWDSGQVGFIVLDSGSAEEAYKWATSELKTYGQYFNGEVFGVHVFEDTELMDTNCPYYGYDHETSGLKDDLQSYLLRISNLSITQQIIDQIS